MYLDSDSDIEDLIVVCNTNLHTSLNISREEFLKRIDSVEEIRSAVNRNFTSFYITSITEFRNLKLLYNILNYGEFPDRINTYRHFAISVKPKLFEWFVSHDFRIIERQIVTWMACLYFFNPDRRDVYEDQFYGPLLQEVFRIINTYILKLVSLKDRSIEDEVISIYDIVKIPEEYDPQKLYDKICNSVYGKRAPGFLGNPFGLSSVEDWGVSRFNFYFVESYLTDNDWDRIVIQGEEDSLKRCESRSDLWMKWKHTFSLFDLTKRNVYSFYLHADSSLNQISRMEGSGGNPGFIYLMRNPTLEKGIFKIGLTRESTDKRAKGLSKTSIPDQYYVICEWHVQDCRKLEKKLKEVLREYRVDPRREFFKLDHRKAISIIDQEVDRFEKELRSSAM